MTIGFKHLALASAFGIVLLPAAAQAEDGDNSQSVSSFRLSTGVSYSTGEYGDVEDTEVVAIPVSLTYKRDGLKVRVSVPWVHISGPGSLLSTPEGRDSFGFDDAGGSDDSGSGSNSGSGASNSGSGSGDSGGIEVEDEDEDDVIDDDDVVDGGGFAGADNTRNGLGDVKVSMAYSFDLGGGTYLEPGAKLKLPTASVSKRLGTGKVDVTASLDLVQEVGAATFYLHGRRKFAGKPTGSSIRSTWGAGGGVSVAAGSGVALGADYDWQQSAFAGRQASSEVSGWTYVRLGSGLGLTVYGGTGLNDNSAKLFGGASVSKRF